MVDNDYVIVEDVFILDEHQMKLGDKVIEIDAKKLQDIADRNNNRISRTGDEIPLIIGHTKDGADEKDQPIKDELSIPLTTDVDLDIDAVDDGDDVVAKNC